MLFPQGTPKVVQKVSQLLEMVLNLKIPKIRIRRNSIFIIKGKKD